MLAPGGFRFNILAVEDSPDWVKTLDGALQRLLGGTPRYSWKIVGTFMDARAELLSRRYHCVSIDQDIPRAVDGAVSAEHGLDLCESLVQDHIVACRTIYTAHGAIRFSNRAGRLGGTPYLEKGPSDPSKGRFSASDWVTFLQKTLDERYIPFALEQAGARLPLQLAERSRRALAGHGKRDHESYLRSWLDIWESAQHLAFAQTLALCGKAGIKLNKSPTGQWSVQESILAEAWHRLGTLGWLQPWAAYLGQPEAGHGAFVGRRFLEGAAAPLRKLRNKHAHTFSGGSWSSWIDPYNDALLILIDLLAFWIENPLLTDVQFHPTKAGTIVAQAMVGDQLPFSTCEVEVGTLRGTPESTTNRACLIWRRNDVDVDVLALDPFVIIERDAYSRQYLMLFSHVLRSGEVVYRSLTDGQELPKAVSTDARRKILSVVA